MIPLRDTISSERTPVVTWALLAANVLIFFYQLTVEHSMVAVALEEVTGFSQRNGLPMVPPSLVEARAQQLYQLWIMQWGLVPGELLQIGGLSEWLAVFTSMFLHGGWMHLAGNALFLYIFADNVEDRMGHGPFLLFYVACGVAAAAAQIAMGPGSMVPMVGASGAIAGVLGAYLVLYPRARIVTLVPIFFIIQFVEIPAILFLGIWFVFQNLVPATAADLSGGGVAYWAHIGGFVAGLAWCLLRRGALMRKQPVRMRARPDSKRYTAFDDRGWW